MERISEIANTVIMPGALAFYDAALSAIFEKPVSAVILFAIAALAAALARSFLILAATCAVALLALLAGSDTDASAQVIATVLGIVSLAILCVWTLAIRERFSRMKAKLNSALAENVATKDMLDREIAWRKAADEKSPARLPF
ncbi:hypothetical protein [Aliihoeflea sp. PC F10.4]